MGEQKQIEKPCRDCGAIMWCTPYREICSTCRRERERVQNIQRRKDKKAATVAPEKLDSDQPAAF